MELLFVLDVFCKQALYLPKNTCLDMPKQFVNDFSKKIQNCNRKWSSMIMFIREGIYHISYVPYVKKDKEQ